MEHPRVLKRVRAAQVDGLALFVGFGVAARGEDDAAGRAALEAHVHFGKALLFHGAHDGQKVGVQKRQHHLRLRVAKAAVVFDDLGAVLGEHEAEVEAALEGAPLGVHRLHRRQEDLPHAALSHVRRVEGVGGDGAHAAGVEAGVAVVGALVVHGRDHRHHGLAVGKGQHGHFRALQKLLDDHAVAALAKGVVAHGVPDRFLGLPRAFADQHALAQRQTVGLDHQRRRRVAHVGKRRFGIVKYLALGRGDAVLLHQALGKNFAGFDLGGARLGAEAGDAQRVQAIHAAHGQRVVRRDHGEVDAVFRGEARHALYVRGLDVHALRVLRDAAVARQGVNGFCLGVLFQHADERVFAPAAANDHQLHRLPSPDPSGGTGARR